MKQGGFTLIELMLALVIISILSSVAYGSYTDYVENARTRTAIADITTIDAMLNRHFTNNFSYPADLTSLNVPLDPWGNSYRYLNIALVTGNGGLRKDRSLNPLNSDYDLYSLGPDGDTSQSLRPPQSHDDIIRAYNGGFIGKVADF